VKEKFIDTIETKLETRGTKKIIFPNRAYMEIHDTVYEMCTGRPNYSADLHCAQGSVIRNYLLRVVLPAITNERRKLERTGNSHNDENIDNNIDNNDNNDDKNKDNSITNYENALKFLEELQYRWNNHTIMRKHYSIFFGYLDRWYVKQQSLPTIKESVLNAFKETVYQQLDLEDDTLDCLIEFINGDRDRRRSSRRRSKSTMKTELYMDMDVDMDMDTKTDAGNNHSEHFITNNVVSNSSDNDNGSANDISSSLLSNASSDDDYDINETINLIKSIIGMYKEMGGCMKQLEGRLLKSLREYYSERWKIDLLRDHSVEGGVAELRETLDEEIKIFVTNCHLFSESKLGEEIIGKWLLEYVVQAASLERAGNNNSINNETSTSTNTSTYEQHFLQKVIDVHEKMEINKYELKLEFTRASREYYAQLRSDWMKNKVIPINEYMIRAEKSIKDEIRLIRFYIRSIEWGNEIFGAILEELITKFAIEFIDGQADD